MARTRPRYYVVKRGRGFWQPTPRMRALGFRAVACGLDGPEAWALAEMANRHWDAVRSRVAQMPQPKNRVYDALYAFSAGLAAKLECELEFKAPQYLGPAPRMRGVPILAGADVEW